MNAAANAALGTPSQIWEENRALALLNYAALSIGVLIALWGSPRIARRLEELGASTHFRGVQSVGGPLLAAAATAVVFATVAYLRDGWGAAVLRGTTWLLIGVALWTFLWVYASLQLGLHRLGGEHLVKGSVNVDPMLGMRPLGHVAFMGLWMLLAWLAPLVLTGLPDVPGAILGLAVLGVALGLFFLSLYRLHRQMVEAKREEIAVARDLYAQAYLPVPSTPKLEVLEEQRGLLGAADALEKRANAIHDWPIDEGTFARVLTVTTSVVAMTIARLILDPLGL
jgi:hypothetical protein